MDIIGKWKVKQFNLITPEGNMQFTPENLPEGDEYGEFGAIAKCLTEFAPDGMMYTLMPIPEGISEAEIEAAKADGAQIRDGFIVTRATAWKEENGVFKYDTNIEGEILGEEVDPFAAIEVLPDGCILTEFGMVMLERA